MLTMKIPNKKAGWAPANVNNHQRIDYHKPLGSSRRFCIFPRQIYEQPLNGFCRGKKAVGRSLRI